MHFPPAFSHEAQFISTQTERKLRNFTTWHNWIKHFYSGQAISRHFSFYNHLFNDCLKFNSTCCTNCTWPWPPKLQLHLHGHVIKIEIFGSLPALRTSEDLRDLTTPNLSYLSSPTSYLSLGLSCTLHFQPPHALLLTFVFLLPLLNKHTWPGPS